MTFNELRTPETAARRQALGRVIRESQNLPAPVEVRTLRGGRHIRVAKGARFTSLCGNQHARMYYQVPGIKPATCPECLANAKEMKGKN